MQSTAATRSAARRPVPHPLEVQGRVIAALMLREMRTRYGRARAGYLWAFSQPLGQLVIYSALFQGLGRLPPIGPNNEIFVLSGIIPFMTFSNVATRVGQAASANQALFTFPGVRVMDAAIARALLEAATFLAVGLIFFAALALFDAAVTQVDLAYIALGVGAACGLGFGFGLVTLSVGALLPAWDKIVQIMMVPLYFASGVFFLPEALAPEAGKVLAYNPVMHVIALIRSGLYVNFPDDLLSLRYVGLWTVGLILAGLAGERAARRRIMAP